MVSSRSPGGLDNYQIKTLEKPYRRAQLARAELRSFSLRELTIHTLPAITGNGLVANAGDGFRFLGMGLDAYIGMAGGTSDDAMHGLGATVALNIQGEDFSVGQLLLDAVKAVAS
jgi:hypothetical protein